jgi:hypothetical protein
VRAFKDVLGADINVIRVGETVYDIKMNRDGGWDTAPTPPKAAAQALIGQFEQRARLNWRFTWTRPSLKSRQL